jgi:cytochrome c-type biogenesis protein CcmH
MTLSFLLGAVALTVAAVAVVVVPLLRAGEEGASPAAAVGTALLIPVVALLAYVAASSYPWSEPPPDVAAPAAADGPALRALKDAVAREPGRFQSWSRLAEGLLVAERFPEAQLAFRRALELQGRQDTALLLAYAEAAVLADRNALGGEAGRLIEQVLVREPGNPKALWYGGMAAIGRGESEQAVTRWRSLLALSPPPAVQAVIEQQLARPGAPGPPAGAGQAGVANAGIVLRVSLAAQYAARASRAGAAVFVFAREPGGAGPPLAAVRRAASELPLVVTLTDADSMVPGRSLAGHAELAITARLAADGEALPASGDVVGEASWRAGSAGELAIVMDRELP